MNTPLEVASLAKEQGLGAGTIIIITFVITGVPSFLKWGLPLLLEHFRLQRQDKRDRLREIGDAVIYAIDKIDISFSSLDPKEAVEAVKLFKGRFRLENLTLEEFEAHVVSRVTTRHYGDFNKDAMGATLNDWFEAEGIKRGKK